MKPAKRYIFVISRPSGASADLESLISALETLGIQVDREYGAAALDPPVRSRFALRGTADADVIERVVRDSSIKAFADPEVGQE